MIETSYFGYGLIPKYTLVSQNYYERTLSGRTKLYQHLTQKSQLSTTENWKSRRFVFCKDMQQLQKNTAGIKVLKSFFYNKVKFCKLKSSDRTKTSFNRTSREKATEIYSIQGNITESVEAKKQLKKTQNPNNQKTPQNPQSLNFCPNWSP